MLPLPVPSDEDAAVEEVVVDVVGKGGARVVAAALLATTAGFEDVEAVKLEELIVEASVGVADAAQAHTALAKAPNGYGTAAFEGARERPAE